MSRFVMMFSVEIMFFMSSQNLCFRDLVLRVYYAYGWIRRAPRVPIYVNGVYGVSCAKRHVDGVHIWW